MIFYEDVAVVAAVGRDEIDFNFVYYIISYSDLLTTL